MPSFRLTHCYKPVADKICREYRASRGRKAAYFLAWLCTSCYIMVHYTKIGRKRQWRNEKKRGKGREFVF